MRKNREKKDNENGHVSILLKVLIVAILLFEAMVLMMTATNIWFVPFIAVLFLIICKILK